MINKVKGAMNGLTGFLFRITGRKTRMPRNYLNSMLLSNPYAQVCVPWPVSLQPEPSAASD